MRAPYRRSQRIELRAGKGLGFNPSIDMWTNFLFLCIFLQNYFNWNAQISAWAGPGVKFKTPLVRIPLMIVCRPQIVRVWCNKNEWISSTVVPNKANIWHLWTLPSGCNTRIESAHWTFPNVVDRWAGIDIRLTALRIQIEPTIYLRFIWVLVRMQFFFLPITVHRIYT